MNNKIKAYADRLYLVGINGGPDKHPITHPSLKLTEKQILAHVKDQLRGEKKEAISTIKWVDEMLARIN